MVRPPALALFSVALAAASCCPVAGDAEPGTCFTSPSGAISCPANSDRVGEAGHQRQLLWQLPPGDPPPDGWPVAVLFQGSLFPAQTWWDGFPGEVLGGLHAVELTERLFGAGYAVFTPEAEVAVSWCWNTNVPPWVANFQESPDKAVLDVLFREMDEGRFGGDGALDTSRMVAGGISSGGYMTSRMSDAYPGRFSALAVISGSWATCAGPFCALPDDLPAGHPPTFFGHGAIDPVVPVGTMRSYKQALDALGVETEEWVEPGVTHAWFDGEPEAVVEWFLAH